ncbi:ATP-dependent DNA ligase [Agromyces atrinae]|uniref:DNA ligase (ATP) n=1 Tax=Agromyces atrinae TaxID=592376 RepID=A0A4Q2M023_9MICO|nr:ATP-dependent DNA ligase [Agromyces atrinae]NYD68430.1 bifunctional non-homologous end joining protein LigD [Agromyces atrinae]RXZ85174.1 ATP-dependent DNA ligase [Agromyces atrinae]
MAEQTVRVGGRRLRLSNLDKVMYPESGMTKGEVIDYYRRIAPVMIPHITGRPGTRKRWVHGVGTTDEPGAVFFAKDLGPGAPEWVHRATIAHADHDNVYPLIDDLATLVWIAQSAALEIHVPQWRFGAGDTHEPPDRLVLDLDPGEGTGLAECAEVARRARVILSGMGLDPVPVTSGSKGIHLYAPLDGSVDSEQASALAHELARSLEADDPDLVVSRMKRDLRGGKVFVDWSQNSASKTTVAPYSLRGRPLPAVAAPRTWEEIDDPDLRQLTPDEVVQRVEADGDPMARLGFHAGARADDGGGPLASYRAKRVAAKTPEPVPESSVPALAASADDPRFVVQEHHARALHFDFRLEHHGVFVSWAVPKGIPIESSENHLAVQTEDHPLEYGSFEGTIPAGEYGAGDVTIWDEGRYELEKWRADEIIVRLSGRPGGPIGRARYALIRTDGEGEKSSWLLHRMKEGRAPASRATRTATSRARPTAQAPMLASPATRAEIGDREVSVEMKWDGIRAICTIDDGTVRLTTRSRSDVSKRYPELLDLAGAVDAKHAVLDGEIVALDARGRPDFGLLQKRMNLSKEREITREAERTPVRLYLFDVLEIDDESLLEAPLTERRARLEALVTESTTVLVPPTFGDDIDAAVSASLAHGLEGVMVKDPASTYEPGVRSTSWQKLKNSRMQDVVIGGYRPGQGARRGRIGSLLLGIPDDEGLVYVGRVGTGFTDRELDRLGTRLRPLERKTSPFVAVPARESSDAVWVTPKLVGEIEFAEWTASGSVRQASWRGLRPETTAAEVRRES